MSGGVDMDDETEDLNPGRSQSQAVEIEPPGLIVEDTELSRLEVEESLEPIRRAFRFPNRKLDRDAVDVVRRLRRHEYSAYLVGGCVRDLYLSLSPKDFDVSTSARPDEIKRVFRNSRIIGRRFRLAHIYFRGGKIIETATFRGNVTDVDSQSDEEQDLLITRDNVWGTEKEDALRRDFTINGLMYDISKGEIIDHVGGLADLDKRKIRTIGAPNIRLREDPVRILRAIRFSAKLDFELDADLKRAMVHHGGEISRCAKARVLEETLKLFRFGHGTKSVEILIATEVIDIVLPQLSPYLGQKSSEELRPETAELFSYLQALDALVLQRGQVSDALILTVVLMIPIQKALEKIEPRFHGQQLNLIILELTEHMMLTRRTRERARQMLLAQKHLRQAEAGKRPRRRVSPQAMVKRSYFADALDLFEIWSVTHDQEHDQVKVWRERAGESDSDCSPSDDRDGLPAKQRPPRRRRRRRNPKPKT